MIIHIIVKDDKKETAYFEFKIGKAQWKDNPHNQEKEKQKMVEITITNEQKIKVTLKPVTMGGKPAVLDGIPKWEVINGASTIVPSADGLSCELISSDAPGDSVFAVSADADLGSGVQTIADSITLHVQGAQAANLGLVVGTAEPK